MTQYCSTQQISQMWLYFASEKTGWLLAVHQRGKFDTGIESLLLIRIPSLCNTFTSTTLSKMIRFWICKDQNDSLHTAHHAKPLRGHIWSHFDWDFESRRDQTQEFAFGVWKKRVFAITLRNQKMVAQIFYMLERTFQYI